MGKGMHSIVLYCKCMEIKPNQPLSCLFVPLQAVQSVSQNQLALGMFLYRIIPETILADCLRFYFIVHAAPVFNFTRHILYFNKVKAMFVTHFYVIYRI